MDVFLVLVFFFFFFAGGGLISLCTRLGLPGVHAQRQQHGRNLDVPLDHFGVV